ncbi:hypothetical protein JTB14_020266 [Gonioctena quinquepunctata]|nr:hypothetical protein JTB14_020266 [Gonioctena quinquepunctata]
MGIIPNTPRIPTLDHICYAICDLRFQHSSRIILLVNLFSNTSVVKICENCASFQLSLIYCNAIEDF